MPSAKQSYISRKIHEIKENGVRRNTHAPVSKSNPRKPVSERQRLAIALNSAREAGHRVPPPKH